MRALSDIRSRHGVNRRLLKATTLSLVLGRVGFGATETGLAVAILAGVLVVPVGLRIRATPRRAALLLDRWLGWYLGQHIALASRHGILRWKMACSLGHDVDSFRCDWPALASEHSLATSLHARPCRISESAQRAPPRAPCALSASARSLKLLWASLRAVMDTQLGRLRRSPPSPNCPGRRQSPHRPSIQPPASAITGRTPQRSFVCQTRRGIRHGSLHPASRHLDRWGATDADAHSPPDASPPGTRTQCADEHTDHTKPDPLGSSDGAALGAEEGH